MKTKLNIWLIVSLTLFIFSLTFLISHLIMKGLYIDAAFAVVVPVLFGLMVHFIRKGE